MPSKINELVIQIKVQEESKQKEKGNHPSGDHVTEQKKLGLAKDILELLEEKEVR